MARNGSQSRHERFKLTSRVQRDVVAWQGVQRFGSELGGAADEPKGIERPYGAGVRNVGAEERLRLFHPPGDPDCLSEQKRDSVKRGSARR